MKSQNTKATRATSDVTPKESRPCGPRHPAVPKGVFGTGGEPDTKDQENEYITVHDLKKEAGLKAKAKKDREYQLRFTAAPATAKKARIKLKSAKQGPGPGIMKPKRIPGELIVETESECASEKAAYCYDDLVGPYKDRQEQVHVVHYLEDKPKYLAKRLTASVYQGLQHGIEAFGSRNSAHLALSHRVPSPAEKLNK